jgi:basic amino acid/polyamine antiporter, APA family
MSNENADEGLKRIVGVPGLAATVVNFSIGAGIYAFPAIIGIQLGAAGIVGYLLCGIMFAAIILCYVEIGSKVKTSGGSYAYVETAFGPYAGFIVNWLFFFGWGILGDAAIMNIVADSLSVIFPAFLNPIMRIILFFILVSSMAFVNVINSKLSVSMIEGVTIIKLIPLLTIIVFGFSHVQFSNLHWEHLPSLKAFGDTALILFFAFAGFETSLNVSGEIKNPKRTVPRGILLGGISVLIIYILIQTVTYGVLGAGISQFKDAPLAAVAERIVGPTGVTILIFAAAISGLGAISGDVLASSRLLFAGANDGIFPKFLGKIHPKYTTPYWAVIIYSLLIFILSISGGFKQLAILASGALLLIYLAVVLALIKIRMKKDSNTENSFKVPVGLLIPSIAIAAIIYVLSNLSNLEIASLVVFVVVLSLIYLIMRKWKNMPEDEVLIFEKEKKQNL